MNNSIILNEVSFKYASENIFCGFSYEFTENNIYGITGKNGSGKSTLLKLISGYLQPQIGSVSYNFGDIQHNAKSVYKILSFYAPYINYSSALTALENYRFIGKLRNQKSDNAKLDYLINIFELQKSTDKIFDKLSTGTQNKFKLIQNFIFRNKILLFDEPFENLDETGIYNLKNTIRESHKDKIIIISSNILEHLDICNFLVNL